MVLPAQFSWAGERVGWGEGGGLVGSLPAPQAPLAGGDGGGGREGGALGLSVCGVPDVPLVHLLSVLLAVLSIRCCGILDYSKFFMVNLLVGMAIVAFPG